MPGKVECNACGDISTFMIAMNDHIHNSMQRQGKAKCNTCGEISRTLRAINDHIQKILDSDKSVYLSMLLIAKGTHTI